MKFTATIAALASVVAVVRAGGSIDNSAVAGQIASAASTLNGAGNYVLTNVATGQTLSFSRSGVTNFFPQAGNDPVSIQFNGNQARISGGNNKCASAQWDANYEGGVDYAAVAYACAVGSGPLTGTATLERTKQWWYLVPTGDSAAPAATPATASSPEPKAETTTEAAQAASATPETQAYQFNNADVQAKAAVAPAASSSDAAPAPSSNSKQATRNPAGYWDSSASTISLDGIDTSKVNRQDRSTWICRHPGWWLANHPNYVYTAGHVECASDLKAYLASQQGQSRMGKRSHLVTPSHQELAKKLAKRGSQSYYIIAVDHIHDMATRAIGSGSLSTFGGYTSTRLDLWNKGNSGQMWTISSA
ncbi:hypothetical protein BMF94_2234 [Rhodotorula taiwanensis]|uniref:Uncharacterized protein n=1 Tax=Rhodotorula taiwanensis TaxID=741276 RepID=A0A2S5BDC5_9BASI|nr:hypothetical protein BMF94_2234 [Rhodotorula taiwanensis]